MHAYKKTKFTVERLHTNVAYLGHYTALFRVLRHPLINNSYQTLSNLRLRRFALFEGTVSDLMKKGT